MTYIPYPRSLYRKADHGEVYHGIPCEVLTVDSAEEEAAAFKAGWFSSPTEADAGKQAPESQVSKTPRKPRKK